MEWDIWLPCGSYRVKVAITGSTWLSHGQTWPLILLEGCHVHPVTATMPHIPCLHSAPIAGSNPGGGQIRLWGFIDLRLDSDPFTEQTPQLGQTERELGAYITKFCALATCACDVKVDSWICTSKLQNRAVNNASIKSRYICFATQYFE